MYLIFPGNVPQARGFLSLAAKTSSEEYLLPTENHSLHNALHQVRVDAGRFHVEGFSISGLASYLQFPELDFVVDIGECPVSAVSLDHVFLTHAHGDHSRCLMRHQSLRKMMGIPSNSVYYMSPELVERAGNWIHAEALFEGVPDHRFQLPQIVPAVPGEKVPLAYRKDLSLEAFAVKHSIPAMGCTVFLFKNKLKKEYLNTSTDDIIALRKSGVAITHPVYEPVLTCMGDIIGESLFEQKHIWNSEVLVTECTFLDDGEEEMARKKGHTHISEIVRALETFGPDIRCKKIILNHFSMKYSDRHIREALENKIPEAFRERVIPFI